MLIFYSINFNLNYSYLCFTAIQVKFPIWSNFFSGWIQKLTKNFLNYKQNIKERVFKKAKLKVLLQEKEIQIQLTKQEKKNFENFTLATAACLRIDLDLIDDDGYLGIPS